MSSKRIFHGKTRNHTINRVKSVRELRHFRNLYFIFWYLLKQLLWLQTNNFNQLKCLFLDRLLHHWHRFSKQVLVKVIEHTTFLGKSSYLPKETFDPLLIGEVVMILRLILITRINIHSTIIKKNILNVESLSVHGFHVNFSDGFFDRIYFKPFFEV